MRIFALVLLLVASSTFATPMTIVFTGQVTQAGLFGGPHTNERQTLATDPYTKAIWEGETVMSGNPFLVSSFTFDSDVPHAGGPSGPWPVDMDLAYQVVTEGIAFEKVPGRFHGPSSFDYNDTGVHSYTESQYSMSDSSPFSDWNHMTFDFNFDDDSLTNFLGGSFWFEAEGAVRGSLRGTIDRAVVYGVPEPESYALLLLGLPLLAAFRRR